MEVEKLLRLWELLEFYSSLEIMVKGGELNFFITVFEWISSMPGEMRKFLLHLVEKFRRGSAEEVRREMLEGLKDEWIEKNAK